MDCITSIAVLHDGRHFCALQPQNPAEGLFALTNAAHGCDWRVPNPQTSLADLEIVVLRMLRHIDLKKLLIDETHNILASTSSE